MWSPLERAKLRLAPLAASLLIRSLRRMIRLHYRNEEALVQARGGNGQRPYILAFWHGRLLLMRYAYPGKRITVLISRHRDGEFIARTLSHFGIHSTRGSSTSGGMAGLREVVRRLRGGWDAAFTPDGPRGPRHVVQQGVIEAAKLSGSPIVPVTFACQSGWSLGSWDRFLVPRPFTRALVMYGEPLQVPDAARGEALEQFRKRLETQMIALEEHADALVRGEDPVSGQASERVARGAVGQTSGQVKSDAADGRASRPEWGRGRRVMIVAGEASGDQHGAGLVREVLVRQPEASFFGLAGPEMRSAGVEALVDVSDVAVVGIQEVGRHLPRIYSAYRKLGRALRERRPDLLVLIDYPEFNLLLARKARRMKVPVLYFVSPQIWAWRPGRLRTISKRVDHMMVLFRFEEEIYRRAGVPVTWVGHPLAGGESRSLRRSEARARLGLAPDDMVIAFLPGSRRSEVRRILPVMLGASELLAKEDPPARFVLPVASTLDEAEVRALCAPYPVRLIPGEVAAVLAAADAAAVASGTATLQAAVAGTPMVIVYKISPLTAWIGRRLIKVRDIGLANLVAGRRVAEELVQEACTPGRIAGALRWLLQPEASEAARRGLSLVREKLGEQGAFHRAAQVTLGMLDGSHGSLAGEENQCV